MPRKIDFVVPMRFDEYHNYLRTGVIPDGAQRFNVSLNGGRLNETQELAIQQLCMEAIKTGVTLAPIEIDASYVPDDFAKAQPAYEDLPESLKNLQRRATESLLNAIETGDHGQIEDVRNTIEGLMMQALDAIPPEHRERVESMLAAQPKPVNPESFASETPQPSEFRRVAALADEQGLNDAISEVAQRIFVPADLNAIDKLIHRTLEEIGVDLGSEASKAIHEISLACAKFGAEVTILAVTSGRLTVRTAPAPFASATQEPAKA